MATFLDLGLFQHIIVVFPFLLVFVGSYAVLNKVNVLGADKGLNAIIAFAVASMFLFVQDATTLLTVITPWFILMLFVLFFVLLIFQFMGVKEETITKKVMDADWGAPHWIIVSVILIIVIAGAGQVFGPRLAGLPGEQQIGTQITDGGEVVSGGQTGTFSGRVNDILFHPKVVGMVLMLLIVTFTIRTLVTDEAEEAAAKKEKSK